jgi:hypothetical protein
MHELSHAHIQGSIEAIGYVRLPSSFKEGLAVMVSGGGGAELISEEAARTAIERGEQIVIDNAGTDRHSLPNARRDNTFLVSSRTGLSTSRNVCELPSRGGWLGL